VVQTRPTADVLRSVGTRRNMSYLQHCWVEEECCMEEEKAMKMASFAVLALVVDYGRLG
jgi:hypothetical protein